MPFENTTFVNDIINNIYELELLCLLFHFKTKNSHTRAHTHTMGRNKNIGQ